MSSIETVSVATLLTEIHDVLTRAGIADPHADAELIVGSVLDVSRGRVQSLAILGQQVDSEVTERIRHIASERAQRIPLQHLTGRAPFRHMDLHVGPGVFVPRPETETVAQFAIDELHADMSPEPYALDLCTGSGAIALALANEVDRARVWAIERDAHARAWAERNVQAYGEGRVTLLDGDVSAEHPELAGLKGAFSVIITNPPYVPSGAVPVDPEVRDHDPADALYSGEDGLALIRTISRLYMQYLRPGGLMVIEHAEVQGAAVRDILTRDGWVGAATHRDLTFKDRATTARASR